MTQTYGYRFLETHPCVPLRIEIDHGEQLDLETIDRWLVDHVGLDPAGLPSPLSSDADARERVAAMVERALLLYGEFVGHVGMPCYRGGRVLAVEAIAGREGAFAVSLALKVLDNLRAEIFTQVLRSALTLIQREFVQPPSPQTAEELLVRIAKNVIEPLSACSPFDSGKESIVDIAYRKEIPYRHLGLGLVRIGWGAKSHLLRYTASDADSAVGMEVCGNKMMTARVLRDAGFPVPDHILVQSADEAMKAAAKLGWPVVAKPPHREQSEGVTIDIDTPEALATAYEVASEYGRQVLIERQHPGYCHRVMIAKDRLVYAVKRWPRGVYGDGELTVAELVAKANAGRMKSPPWRRLPEWPLDDFALTCLARQGLTLSSVPAEGERVSLRPFSAGNWGGGVVQMSDTIHPDNVALACEVTRLLGMAIAGVDIITTDLTRPWHETGAVVNEINFLPEFKWRDREEHAGSIMASLVEGDGRIPVHVLVGEGDVLGHAKALKGQLAAVAGQDCHLTTANYSETATGLVIPMAHETLLGRSVALLLRPDVKALVIAGTPAQMLDAGFAADRLESLHVVHADQTQADRIFRAVQAHVRVAACHRITP